VEVIGSEGSLGTNDNTIILEYDIGKDPKGKAKLFDEGLQNRRNLLLLEVSRPVMF